MLSEGKSSQPNRQSSGKPVCPSLTARASLPGRSMSRTTSACGARLRLSACRQRNPAERQSNKKAAATTKTNSLCVYIHFIYWGEEFDEYIECSSERLAARGSHTFLGHNIYADTPGSRLRIGQRVDALDIHPQNNNRITASIVEISEDESRVKLHWFNYHVKFDEWVNARSTRIRPYGSRQKRNHPDWRRHQLKSEQLMRQERQVRASAERKPVARAKTCVRTTVVTSAWPLRTSPPGFELAVGAAGSVDPLHALSPRSSVRSPCHGATETETAVPLRSRKCAAVKTTTR